MPWSTIQTKTVGPCICRIAVIACVGLWATGCSALDVKKPTAAFRSVQVGDMTPQGFTADFLLDVNNPNTFSIPVTGADYKIALSGVEVAEGETKPPGGSLAAQATAPVRVPVRLRFNQLLAAEQAIAASTRGGGDIPYRFTGALEFSAGKLPLSGPVRVPLEFSGTLPVRQLLERMLRDPSFLTSPDALRFARSVLGDGALRGLPGLDRTLRDSGILR